MSQLLANSLASAAAYTLVAVGFGLIYSTARFFHFAHGAVYTIAAYVSYTVSVYFGFGWWLGLLCGMSSGAIIGWAMEVAIYRRMRRGRASSTVLFIASLGLLVTCQNLISLVFGDGTLILRRESADHVREVAGARISEAQIECIVVALVICATIWVFIHSTKWGRELRATANDPDLARTVGVRINRVVVIVFSSGSALAGLAATMLAQETDLHPAMGVEVLLLAVVGIVIGGVGSVPGIVLGILLVTLLRNLAMWQLAPQWGDAIAFALLIVFLIWRPQGLLGKPIRSATP